MREFGAGDGIQTRDLCLGKATLYQLSYSRNRVLSDQLNTFGL
jgi:hypothetical protein